MTEEAVAEARAGWASREDTAALAAALVTVLLWASAFVGIRSAGKTFSPGALSLGRLLVGALVLLAIAASAGSLGATTYLVPPLSVLLGGSLLSETPPGLALLGGVLCLAGVAVVRRG